MFSTKILSLAAGLLLLVGVALRAQTEVIPLQVDYAVFRADSQNVFLEIYLAFPQNKLTFVPQDSQQVAQFQLKYQILQNDEPKAERQKKFTATLPLGQQPPQGRLFLDAQVFQLDAGNYRAVVQVQDLQSKNTGEFVLDVQAPLPPADKLALSDIELCSRIIKKATTTAFSKNQLTVIPNPSGLYGIQLPVVFYYAEVYNLTYREGEENQYITQATITDLQGKVLREYPEKTHLTPGKNAVLVGGYNVLALPAGTYLLKLRVTDPATGNSVVRSRRFTLVKPLAAKQTPTTEKPETDSRLLLQKYYEKLNEAQLDNEFEKMAYIVSPEEKQIYQQLNVDGKRKFLVEFWSKRDPDPTTPQNEFRNEYIQRINYANAQWGSPRKPGWLTDRGRVFIKYGPPSEIQRYDMSLQQKPVEIWYYDHLEGGVYFIFADLTGYGDYELMHSTYSKEIHQPEWERFISPVPTKQQSTEFPR